MKIDAKLQAEARINIKKQRCRLRREYQRFYTSNISSLKIFAPGFQTFIIEKTLIRIICVLVKLLLGPGKDFKIGNYIEYYTKRRHN